MSESKQHKKMKSKKKYNKPELKKERVMVFGAGCNGKKSGGRKASAGAPDFCTPGKLLS